MFTKSSKNMNYGRHIDNAYMSSGRADLSFTIFLTNKDFYEGGELLIETMNSEEKFKLKCWRDNNLSKYIFTFSRRSS